MVVACVSVRTDGWLEYFAEMSDALEIKSRTQLVNAKITYAVELQSVMRELLTEVGVLVLGFPIADSL